MPLSAGTKLGPYEILAPIGAGGMGEVYRATDTRLHRIVAIKVLPHEKVADSERKRRFLVEARAVSALNHPNIVTLHDIANEGGIDYLVMEYVEGRTLDKLVTPKGLPLAEVTGYSMQIASALAAAHAAGIVHRDIKPANVIVTAESQIKVLDFGLAKLSERAPDREDETLTNEALTEAGTVMGTVAYMSPEQASARPLDSRTDIFSLGVILYELLSGQRPFRGNSQVETLHAIIHNQAPSLAGVSIWIQDILDKALAKDPRERYQHAADLALDLRRSLRTVPGTPDVASVVAPSRRRASLWLATGIVLAMGTAGWIGLGAWRPGLGVSRPWTPRPAAPTNVHVARLTDFVGVEEQPAVSPDGKWVAFIAPDITLDKRRRRQVWVRLLAGGAPASVTHDDADHEHPRWAPDSSSIIYFSGAQKEDEPGTLWEVAAVGGTPRPIASSSGEGDISHDGLHLVTFQSKGEKTSFMILSRDGSKIERENQLPSDAASFRSPRWSPDDHRIAFDGSRDVAFNHTVFVMDADGGAPKPVATASNIQGVAWLPDGSGLVYASSAGSTMAYPPIFNLRTVSKDGGPERQLTFGDESYVEPDLAAAGKVFASRVRMQSDIWRYPVAGSAGDNTKNGVRITHQTGQVQTPSVSPDGKEIVYLSDSGGHANLWVARVDGSSPPRQIYFERDPAAVIGVPVWSPAGDKIVFVRNQAGFLREWLINPDGSGPHEFIHQGRAAIWASQGRWLYYTDEKNCTKKIPVAGGPPVDVRCEANGMDVSSDGSTIYYVPSPARQNELFKARPENGPAQLLARYALSRIPFPPMGYALSPGDRWIAVPLKDAGTTNLWVISTADGSFRQITDFKRPTLIARGVSWCAPQKPHSLAK